MNDDTDDDSIVESSDVSETGTSGSKAPQGGGAQTSVEPLEDRIAAADRRKAEFLDTCRYNLEISQLYQSESRQLGDAKVIAFYQGIAECAAGRIPRDRLKVVRDYFDHASRLVRSWRQGDVGVSSTELAHTQPSSEFVLAQHALYNIAVICHRSGEFETAIERYADVENDCRPYQLKQTDLRETYPLSGVLLAATFGRILARFDQFRVQTQTTQEGVLANSGTKLLSGPSLLEEVEEFLDYVLRVQAAWRTRSTGPSPSDAKWFAGIFRRRRNFTTNHAPREARPRPSGEKDDIPFSSLHTLGLMALHARRIIECLAPNRA